MVYAVEYTAFPATSTRGIPSCSALSVAAAAALDNAIVGIIPVIIESNTHHEDGLPS